MRIILSQGFNLDAAYCHCLYVCVCAIRLNSYCLRALSVRLFSYHFKAILSRANTKTLTLCKHVQTPWATAHRRIKMDEGMTHEYYRNISRHLFAQTSTIWILISFLSWNDSVDVWFARLVCNFWKKKDTKYKTIIWTRYLLFSIKKWSNAPL